MKPTMLFQWGVIIMLISGCSTAGYYAQSVKGQMEIWQGSRPISSVLEDPEVSKGVKDMLELALEIRRFAVEELHLPDNDSYTKFVDLDRPYMVWSVFAAPELSLEPVEWCFLIVGCVNYRGYFTKDSAQEFADQISDQGFDVYVGGVPAYSTLGWFDDPLPNTVLKYSKGDFAGLIFHELAHQVAFAKGDTVFNESFASTVERLGVERWLMVSGDASEIARYRLDKKRDQQVVDLILDYRAQMEAAYSANTSDTEKRRIKQQLVAELKEAYARITKDWKGYSGYRYWFEQPINNAKLISIATYNELIPAFEKLLQNHGGDLKSFYQSVIELAEQPKSSRREALAALNRGQYTF